MNQLATVSQGHLPAYNKPQLALIRNTIAKDCNDQEFNLFIEMAKRTGLDPIRRQIYGIVTNKKNREKRQLVVVTGIDGYRAIANRCQDYRPDEDEPVIHRHKTLKDPDTNPLGISRAVVTVYKHAHGGWHPVKGVAYWEEFAPIKEIWENNEPSGKFQLDPYKRNWRTMGRLMIAKCAEAQALRKGWPEEFSGIYAAEEMDSVTTDEANASEIVEAHEAEQRLALVNAIDSITMLWAAGEALEQVPLGKMADRCMAFLKEAESAVQIEAWRDQNKAALQEFWARQKADALEVKAAMERRIEGLSKPEPEPEPEADQPRAA